jgi:hypothetical protein
MWSLFLLVLFVWLDLIRTVPVEAYQYLKAVGPPGSTSNFGDFTQKLIDINPTYSTTFTGGTNGYPSVDAHNPYVEYGPLALGQFAGDTGRIAFHYFLTDTSTQGSHIAIDDISVNNIVVVPGAGLLAMRGGKKRF